MIYKTLLTVMVALSGVVLGLTITEKKMPKGLLEWAILFTTIIMLAYGVMK